MHRSLAKSWIPAGLCLIWIAPALAAPQTQTEDRPAAAEKNANGQQAEKAKKPEGMEIHPIDFDRIPLKVAIHLPLGVGAQRFIKENQGQADDHGHHDKYASCPPHCFAHEPLR